MFNETLRYYTICKGSLAVVEYDPSLKQLYVPQDFILAIRNASVDRAKHIHTELLKQFGTYQLVNIGVLSDGVYTVANATNNINAFPDISYKELK